VAFVRLNVAVDPVNVAVEITVPFCRRDTDVIPVVEAPVSLNVRLFTVTVLLPGLVSRICWTGTLVAPATWEELPGGFGPCELVTVTTVAVAVNVVVEVAEEVVVWVAVFVKLLVLVAVADGVELGVLVGVPL
jgi:hypothetical protein